jgi:hypothetical protein
LRARSRLIPEIRTELRTTIKGLKKEHLQGNVSFKTFEKNGNVISLTNEISDSYHKTLLLLREKAQNIGLDLSDDRIDFRGFSSRYDVYLYGKEVTDDRARAPTSSGPIPIPYPNTAMASDTTSGARAFPFFQEDALAKMIHRSRARRGSYGQLHGRT